MYVARQIVNTFKMYISKKSDIRKKLLEFIDDENYTIVDYEELINFLKEEIDCNDHSEFSEFICLLSKISKYHHRNPDFKEKLEKILISFENEIKQTFSNSEIFDVFKSSLLILQILFKNKFLTLDKFISNHLLSKYLTFFYPEIKTFFSESEKTVIENFFSEFDLNDLSSIEEKRQIGENDSFICSLIRNDSIEEFVTFVNRHNLPLDSRINPSIYETHSFLIKNKTPRLIEYAAFFGSIQIIKYLQMSDVQLTPSIWLYAIHSNNAELIHFLEENKVETDYIKCYNESIKCHHNQIADYFKDNYMEPYERIDSVPFYALRYHNYEYYIDYLHYDYDFYDLYRFNYSKFVNSYCKIKVHDFEHQFISFKKINIILCFIFQLHLNDIIFLNGIL